jgi:hypothetical protein
MLAVASSGTMSDLTVTQTVDTCMTVSETEFCGADLPTCEGSSYTAVGCASGCETTEWMCVAYHGDWNALVGSPPITFTTFTASFNDVCPSEDAAGDSGPTHIVSFSMAASNDLSDYTTEVRDAIATAVAARLSGVSSTDVRVTVTAGSVNIDIEIDASDESAAETISDTVTTEITSSSTTATSFLQTVSALSTVSVSDVTSPQVRVASRGLDAGGVFGIILGIMCVIGLVLAPVIYRRIKKDESKVVPEEGPVPTPPA